MKIILFLVGIAQFVRACGYVTINKPSFYNQNCNPSSLATIKAHENKESLHMTHSYYK